MSRKTKSVKLDYWDEGEGAHVTVADDPNEVRIGVDPKNFISIREGVVNISPGLGGKFNLQGMSGSMRYGGMIQDTPFPLSLIPSTMATPIAKQTFTPPFQTLLPDLKQAAAIASVFVGL